MTHYLNTQINSGRFGSTSILSSAGIATMHAPAVLREGGSGSYGMGWVNGPLAGVPAIWHDGNNVVASTRLLIEPQTHWGAILLVNANSLIPIDGANTALTSLADGVTRLLAGQTPQASTSLTTFYLILEDTIEDEVERGQTRGSLGSLPCQQAGDSVCQRREGRVRPVYGNQAVGVHQQDRAPVGLRLDEEPCGGHDVVPIVPDGRHPSQGSIDPAHAIGAASPFSENRRRMHGRYPCRGEDGSRPKAPPVHLGDQVVGHILGAGDQVACRNIRQIVVLNRGGHPKEPPIALGQPVALGLWLGGETVVHLERGKDVLPHVGGVGLPRDRLHDESEHVVIGAAIVRATADRSVESECGETAHILL